LSAPLRRPLRHSVARALREQIVASGLEPGARLPSEPELARSLGVSRSSLRGGIALLEEDGIVRRLHGSGTYVSHRPVVRNDLSRNFSVSSMIAATGVAPGSVDERCVEEAAPPHVAAALGVGGETEVCALRRVRTAGARRVVDSTDWCRADLIAVEAMRELDGGSIYAALAERGFPVHHGVATITPDVARGEVARRLRVPDGALLLTLLQLDSTADGTVVLVSQEHHLAEAFEITVYRRGPGDDPEVGE
jgi:DNA-binding GntR family transcriptional regulator